MVLGASESAWDVFGGQLAPASLLSLVVIAMADDVHFPFFVYSHFLNTGKQEQALLEYARDIGHVASRPGASRAAAVLTCPTFLLSLNHNHDLHFI